MKIKIRKIVSFMLSVALCASMLTLNVEATVLKENVEKTRYAATQGFVLLKNENNALPLIKDDKVAVLGNHSFYNKSMFTGYQKSGGGSGDVYGSPVIDIFEGLDKLASDGRIQLYKENEKKYRTHLAFNTLIPNEMTFTDEEIFELAKTNDTAVVTIGRSSSETFDHKDVAGDFYLNRQEEKLLSQIQRADFKKVIVLLNIGTQMDLSFIDQYDIDAAMIVWYPGAEGGNAISDTLIGDVSPSGKLAMTFAKTYNDYSTYGTYDVSNDYVNYFEDIYVGYRYFETFKKYDRIQYPFGYGLSYTTFDIKDEHTEVIGDQIEITATVTNTGNTAGKEVVQAYYSAPQGKLGNPALELAAFKKTSLLQPGDTETVTLTFDIEDMKSFDDTGKIQKSAYLLEAGTYGVYLGNSVADARERNIYNHHIDDLIVVEQLQSQVAPNLLTKRLLANGDYEKLDKQPVLVATSSAITIAAITVQAEDYSDKYKYVTTEDFTNGDYNGTALVKMTDFANTWVAYDINVPKAGKYNLSFRAANGFSEIKDMLDIYVDGQFQPDISLNVPQTGKGILKKEWHNYINTTYVTLDLPEGDVQLVFESKNHGFANLDYFTLTPAGETIEAALPYKRPKAIKTLRDVAAGELSLDEFISQMTDFELAELLGGKLGTLDGNTGGIGGNKKFGIPAVQTADGPAGLRLTSGGTAWPVATLLASSWDPEVLAMVGDSVADEAIANKVDIWLAPGMNIQRDPLCGRNFEYFSEDPLVTAEMAKAITTAVENKGVLITIKHFIANNKEVNRNGSDSRMSERAMREIYLKAFEIVIKEAKPSVLMTSYNYVNGYETASNRELLNNILRNEWGYQGLVMTDWFNQSSHTEELFAGNDVKMPFGDTINLLIGIKDGEISRDYLARSVKRELEMIMKTNLFNDVYDN